MKKSLLFAFVVLLTLTSCEKPDNEVFFKIGSGLEYKFSDIELYDTSTHMLYFKKVHDEFKNIENGSFIMSPPSMFGNYALMIDNWHSDKPDIRNDPRMIALLNQHDLLPSGLAISSGSIVITGTQLTFKFTVTNQDQSGLMIIDIDKTGPNLFHYFTNGLYIYDLAHNEVFSSTIQHQTPDPWNSWKIDWLSELKSGASKQFTITYTINSPINPGEYDTTFEFPGLAYQVTKDQLYQGNSRIWLGDIPHNKRISIQ